MADSVFKLDVICEIMNVLKQGTPEETLDAIAKISNTVQNILYQFNIMEKTNEHLDENLQNQIGIIKNQLGSLKDDIYKIRNLVVTNT